jgi:hypothetical protein
MTSSGTLSEWDAHAAMPPLSAHDAASNAEVDAETSRLSRAFLAWGTARVGAREEATDVMGSRGET